MILLSLKITFLYIFSGYQTWIFHSKSVISCKIARYACYRAGRNCVSFWCLVQCANVTPHYVSKRGGHWSVPHFCARVASYLSSSPLLLLVSHVSFAASPVGSGAWRWRTAPDTNRKRSCGRPDSRRNARSCKILQTLNGKFRFDNH